MIYIQENPKNRIDIAKYLGSDENELFCRLPTGGLVVYQVKVEIPQDLQLGEILKLNLSEKSSEEVVGIERSEQTSFPPNVVWEARLSDRAQY